MNWTPHALIFTLAAIGLAESAYLIRSRRAHQAPVCVVGKTCGVVLESKYNRVFLIHNDLAGLLFYIVISVLTAFLVIGVGPPSLWNLAARAIITAGAAVSLFFIFLQWKILRAWCFWCIMSAVTIFIMTLIILLTLRSTNY